jgi:hypothetical protein
MGAHDRGVDKVAFPVALTGERFKQLRLDDRSIALPRATSLPRWLRQARFDA